MTMDRDPEGREAEWLNQYMDFSARRVLEIGSGDGRLTWRFAHLARWTAGIEIDRELLFQAVSDRPSQIRSKIDFITAAAECLPFRAGSFDRALLAWSL